MRRAWPVLETRPIFSDQDQDQDQMYKTKTKTKTRCRRPRPRAKLQDQDQDQDRHWSETGHKTTVSDHNTGLCKL